MSLLWLLVLLLLLSAAFGWWYPSTGDGRSPYWGWSPAGIILLVIIILLVTSGLH